MNPVLAVGADLALDELASLDKQHIAKLLKSRRKPGSLMKDAAGSVRDMLKGLIPGQAPARNADAVMFASPGAKGNLLELSSDTPYFNEGSRRWVDVEGKGNRKTFKAIGDVNEALSKDLHKMIGNRDADYVVAHGNLGNMRRRVERGDFPWPRSAKSYLERMREEDVIGDLENRQIGEVHEDDREFVQDLLDAQRRGYDAENGVLQPPAVAQHGNDDAPAQQEEQNAPGVAPPEPPVRQVGVADHRYVNIDEYVESGALENVKRMRPDEAEVIHVEDREERIPKNEKLVVPMRTSKSMRGEPKYAYYFNMIRPATVRDVYNTSGEQAWGDRHGFVSGEIYFAPSNFVPGLPLSATTYMPRSLTDTRFSIDFIANQTKSWLAARFQSPSGTNGWASPERVTDPKYNFWLTEVPQGNSPNSRVGRSIKGNYIQIRALFFTCYLVGTTFTYSNSPDRLINVYRKDTMEYKFDTTSTHVAGPKPMYTVHRFTVMLSQARNPGQYGFPVPPNPSEVFIQPGNTTSAGFGRIFAHIRPEMLSCCRILKDVFVTTDGTTPTKMEDINVQLNGLPLFFFGQPRSAVTGNHVYVIYQSHTPDIPGIDRYTVTGANLDTRFTAPADNVDTTHGVFPNQFDVLHAGVEFGSHFSYTDV